MYLLIIFLPLFSFIIISLFGRFLGKKGSIFIALIYIIISALISFFIFYEVILCYSVCTFKLFTWFESNILKISWGFLFDQLTVIMLVVVTFISSLVHLYSVSYMSEDPHVPRFISYLSLFTFFMLILITADNFIQMFFGWEGVGLASYLLINFWHTRILANKAALKALIVNKIGDFGLIIRYFNYILVFYSLDFSIIFSMAPIFYKDSFIFFNYEFDKLTIITIFLFIGAIGKSAQIGLHTWLPDAMEGPTPVSALIHAATMVTAGIFVLLRSITIIRVF